MINKLLYLKDVCKANDLYMYVQLLYIVYIKTKGKL